MFFSNTSSTSFLIIFFFIANIEVTYEFFIPQGSIFLNKKDYNLYLLITHDILLLLILAILMKQFLHHFH